MITMMKMMEVNNSKCCALRMMMLTMIKITSIKMMEVNLLILSKCDLLRGNKSDGAECHVAVRTCLEKKTINKMLKAGGTVFFVNFVFKRLSLSLYDNKE